MSITLIVGKFDHCKTCETLSEVYETPAGVGPYCRRCIDEACDTEESGDSL